MTDIAISRECGNCTACCEGWLEGEIYGYKMFRGRPCHFLGCDRCSIYEQRPEKPCRQFNCVWLVNADVPEWMKPELSKVIIKKCEYEVFVDSEGGGRATYILANDLKIKNTASYWSIIECGETISGPVLDWLVQYCLEKNQPIMYQVNGTSRVIGPPEFHMWFEETKKRRKGND